MIRAILAITFIMAAPLVTVAHGLHVGIVTLAAGAVLAVWSRK